MTDHLTDEQVRDLWSKAERYKRYLRSRECWKEARAALGLDEHEPTPFDLHDRVRDMATALRAERGLLDVPGFPVDRFPGWEDVIPLLAEVRQARGIE